MLTNTLYQNSEHIDLGASRRSRNFQDTTKTHSWFSTRNLFFIEDENLYSLSSGMVSDNNEDRVNCEEAERIGHQIQLS